MSVAICPKAPSPNFITRVITAMKPPMLDARAWRQLAFLLGLMLLSTLPFWIWPLDLTLTGMFYHPELGAGDAAWPVQNTPLVQFCYKAAPLLTLLIALPALFVVLLGAWIKPIKSWRAHAAVVVLTVVLGPGLLVNGMFKELWDRPRPVQTENFGGDYPYAPPLVIGEAKGGKSFPCGHCSAGFALAALWLVLRTRRPRLAWLALGASIVLGAAMGYARLAAGGHYLSDILWAAWLSFLAAWVSYYLIMRIPQREAGWSPAPLQLAHPVRWVVGGVISMAVVVGALMATPVDLRWQHTFDAETLQNMGTLRIERASVEVWLGADEGEPRVEIDAQWQGFGLPGSRVRAKANGAEWTVTPRGVFSELRDRVQIRASLQPGQGLHLQLDPHAQLRVHCAQGQGREGVQSNLPSAQVHREGCNAS